MSKNNTQHIYQFQRNEIKKTIKKQNVAQIYL